MRRRKFIAASSAFVGSASGCLGALGEPDSKGNATADGEAEPNDLSGDDEKDAYTLSVGVEHPKYVVTTRSKFSNEMNRAERVEEFDESTRRHVREAVEKGSAGIDEPEDELLEAVQGVRHIRNGDDVYALDYSLPEYVVTGTVADVSEDEVDEDSVVHVYDDILRSLGPDNRQIVAMRTSVVGGGRGELETGEYRTTSLSEELEEFLKENDYIAVSTSENPTVTDEYVELKLSREDPNEYYIFAERLTHEDLFDVEEVRYSDELPENVADVVRTAVGGEYRGDTIPEGFEDTVGNAYFLMDDEVHRPKLSEPDYESAPVEVGAEVVNAGVGEVEDPVGEGVFEKYSEEFEDTRESDDEDSVEQIVEELWDEYRPDDGGVFELTLTNTSDETVYVFSGAPAPFGVLYAEDAESEGADDRARRLVWSETYVEDGDVNVGPQGLAVNSIGLNTEIDAGDSETEMHEVAFAPGEYRVEEDLSVSRDRRDDGEIYPYTVVIEVEEESSDDEA